MNWFHENRFMGAFLFGVGVCTLGAAWFLLSAKSDWDDAVIRFGQIAEESNRLQRLAPYPSDENLRRLKLDADGYAMALAKLKDELKVRMIPLPPMAPNEFQSHLRLATGAAVDKARAGKVKLPDRFYLGFDEFASALPSEAAAPLLGQELSQVEWLLGALIEARIDSLASFHRVQLLEERLTPPAPVGRKPGAIDPRDRNLIERKVVETTFVSTPAAARKVLNQIAGASPHFFIIRRLRIRNEREKGPPRDTGSDTGGIDASAGSLPARPVAALHFIVGSERVETTAKIEIVRFTF